MSFTYITKIMSNKDVVETKNSSDLKKAITWADNNAILGDLVVISEGYEGADGIAEEHDHVMSYVVD